MTASIKITELTDIGTDIDYTTLVPVVNLSGTPITQKATLREVGNLILEGANGTLFSPAAQAVIAGTVTTHAQPNITSVGTLTSLAVTGNITSGGNIVTSNIAAPHNLKLNAGGANFTFGEGGALYWPGPSGQLWAIEGNPDQEFEFISTSNIVITTDTSNLNSHFTFDSQGIFRAPSNVVLSGTRLSVGPDSESTSLTNPTLVVSSSGSDYVQAALINKTPTGSADWIGYPDNYPGPFNDPHYTITGPNDGYLFSSGLGVGGGNLVLATDSTGTTNDIVFGLGGFSSSNIFGRISYSNNALELSSTGANITFYDGSKLNSSANIVQWTTAPISNVSSGTIGQAAHDSGGNLFVCVATDRWAKFAGTTSW